MLAHTFAAIPPDGTPIACVIRQRHDAIAGPDRQTAEGIGHSNSIDTPDG